MNEKDKKCVLICINNRKEKNSKKKNLLVKKNLNIKAKFLKKALGHAIKKENVQKFMEKKASVFFQKKFIQIKND